MYTLSIIPGGSHFFVAVVILVMMGADTRTFFKDPLAHTGEKAYVYGIGQILFNVVGPRTCTICALLQSIVRPH